VVADLKGHYNSELVARSGRICDGENAAGGGCAGGFYFFKQAGAAEAGGELSVDRGNRDDVR
jgi:hypothetical protein